MYEIKILPNRRLTSLECEIDTAVEPFREKNNNVAYHNIYQGRYYLLIFSSFS